VDATISTIVDQVKRCYKRESSGTYPLHLGTRPVSLLARAQEIRPYSRDVGTEDKIIAAIERKRSLALGQNKA
jgi:hypothetical protein